MTEEGITERLNRSIQAAGMQYLRFKHMGMEKVVSEIKLLIVNCLTS
ncbi:hypothetical protein [Tissierella sp.]|nr:hypothetical protein [Tissierella sp.]